MPKNCPIFGESKDLSYNKLPTFQDIVKCYNENPKLNNAAKLANEVSNIWSHVGIPTNKNILRSIKLVLENYVKKSKSVKSTNRSKNFEKNLEVYRKDSERLFDCAACKCSIQNIFCKCDEDKRVPPDMMGFLEDQRNSRILCIPRKLQTVKTLKRIIKKPITKKKIGKDHDEEMSNSDADSEEEYVPPKKQNKLTKKTKSTNMHQNRINIAPLVEIADRYRVSRRAAAAISTATLKTFGIIDKNNTQVIDKNKIQRSAIANRKSVRNSELNNLR